jgi:hypothetical protein
MQIITKEDEEIKELHLKKLFEKSKKLVFIKHRVSKPTEEQEQWIENKMLGSANSWKCQDLTKEKGERESK